LDSHDQKSGPAGSGKLSEALHRLELKYAPDKHMGIFTVGVETRGESLVLTGEVDRVEARTEALRAASSAGIKVADEISVLPAASLGDKTFAIACLSVASGRELPDHKTEMGTQILMGHTARVLKASRFWLLVQSSDGYLSWVENGAMVQCSQATADAWTNAPRVIVTAFDDCVRESPQADAQPVSDVVMGDLLKTSGEESGWLKVELPDHRAGFLPAKSATAYSEWKQTRVATADSIERTAKTFLGRPYLWGGNSPKGFDCSGFAKSVFFLNGIQLNRNASEQAWQGASVAVDAHFKNLRKGDLLFFGWGGRRGRPGMVSHVGIYLGDKLFIQSSQRVKISSLDPESPIFDEHHSRNLLFARRVLSETTAAQVQR
jgi:cell wall-associated NlpC family hydrolase